MRVSAVIAYLLCLAAPAAAGYASEEMCMIPWGEGPDQLKIGLPSFEDVNETPGDSTDDWIEKGGGPNDGFVNLIENIYFYSYEYLQLKAFNKNGGLLIDFSKGESGHKPEFFRGWLRSIYVDSLNRIYIFGGALQDYIAVVDENGTLLQKLHPYGPDSGVPVANLYFNSADVLTILLKIGSYHTYSNESFTEGGARGWKAKDNHYYYANLVDSTLFRFIRYESPDISGAVSDLHEAIKEYEVPPAAGLSFLGVDDEMNIYVYERERERAKTRVLIFNTNYDLIDQIVFPDRGNRYRWYMTPFMRPKDGNIYEFRCLDDGLHVVRWSKQ